MSESPMPLQVGTTAAVVTEVGCGCGWRFTPQTGYMTIDDANARLDYHLDNDQSHASGIRKVWVAFEE
jgi:hypothetical protein